jgi:5-methylcytosine-specific restriction endonuclease McrA
MHHNLFFPRLQRRSNYSVKRTGDFYEYSHYKQEIREDCLGRCVYCDSHENEVGGHECMELDHFKPKKYDEHKHLINHPSNLVWSCRGCNRLKTSITTQG